MYISHPVCTAAAAVAPNWSDAVTVLHSGIISLCGPRFAGKCPPSLFIRRRGSEWSDALMVLHQDTVSLCGPHLVGQYEASSASAGHLLIVMEDFSSDDGRATISVVTDFGPVGGN